MAANMHTALRRRPQQVVVKSRNVDAASTAFSSRVDSSAVNTRSPMTIAWSPIFWNASHEPSASAVDLDPSSTPRSVRGRPTRYTTRHLRRICRGPGQPDSNHFNREGRGGQSSSEHQTPAAEDRGHHHFPSNYGWLRPLLFRVRADQSSFSATLDRFTLQQCDVRGRMPLLHLRVMLSLVSGVAMTAFWVAAARNRGFSIAAFCVLPLRGPRHQ